MLQGTIHMHVEKSGRQNHAWVIRGRNDQSCVIYLSQSAILILYRWQRDEALQTVLI